MRAYRVLAKNIKTRQRIERNPLTAAPVTDENEAWSLARALAEQQQRVTGQQWIAEVEVYETRS